MLYRLLENLSNFTKNFFMCTNSIRDENPNTNNTQLIKFPIDILISQYTYIHI